MAALRSAILPLLVAPVLLAAVAPGPIRVRDAGVRPTPPGAATASGHLVVENLGRADDQLVGLASPDAAGVEVHSMDMSGGVMRMRPVPGPLRVPAGGRLDLSAASGRHLMLVSPRRRLAAGDTVRLVLQFAHAGRRVVDAPVGADRP